MSIPLSASQNYALTGVYAKNIDGFFTKSNPITPTNSEDKIEDMEIESFICPISLERFKDPVVDKCGHTYSKGFIESYCKMKSVDGKIFPCPMDRSTLINIDDFKPNYSIISAMDDADKMIKMTQKIHSDKFASLEAKLDASIAKGEAAILEQKEIALKTNRDLVEIYSNAKYIKMQMKVRSKQVENLRNMSLRERISIVFFYSYLDSIQNKGLDDYELSILKDKPNLIRPANFNEWTNLPEFT